MSFAVVASVAAAISYSHVRQVAGESWQASLLPLSIDGLLVAGSLALWLERRDGGKGSPLSWISVALGLLASLGANLASSKPLWFPREWVDPAVAVWPAIALALSFELLVRVARTSSVGPIKEKADGAKPQPAAQTVGELAAERAPDPAPAVEDATLPQEQHHPDEETELAARLSPEEFADHRLAAGDTAGTKKLQKLYPHLTEHKARTVSQAARARRDEATRLRVAR